MKDIQGYNRGKCNSCECLEYRPPPADTESSAGKPKRLRCEYCNHTPVEHVWLVELGACNSCGADNCNKYESEESNSYTDCGYCGCSPNDHKGAENLRKKAVPAASIVPRADAFGNPVQSSQYGTCKRPGCNYPRRIVDGHLHDYCSRTCATKDKTAPHHSAPMTLSTQNQSTLVTSPPPRMVAVQGPGLPSTSDPSSSGVALCTGCNKRPANPGHKWCSNCYATIEAQNKH